MYGWCSGMDIAVGQESVDYITGEGILKDAIEWYERNLDYNVPGGKLNRDMSVYPKVAMLGWAIELVRPTFSFMMDSLIRRRGQPCWYRVSKVGQIVISDSFMLEAAISFLETTFQTERGSLSLLQRMRHSLTMIYKTAYYSFYLPVAVALYALAKPILIPFSDTPEQIRNIGTDIFDNRCSWCVNTTLPVCTPKQQLVLDENYGRKDSECERRVKVVFESPEVGLWELIAMIGEVPEVEGKGRLKTEVLKSFLDKIYKRTK
ncbi:terpenoid synthase [Armillaria gallica]|uniref:Terpenoid synthase n=1 Tax=Armillaria gallica TaxID=47427 RepID=A0A2H3CXX7_ARMGA|nr:terpenoid synthase [Armillaria gallica]